VKKIADGVWFREGDMKQGHCNNVIIEMKDYLIVVDANFPSGARLAIADAKKLSPKPVKYVFITHHHGDHDYGSAVWSAAGATTFAYKAVADEMRRYEPKRWLDTAKSRADVADLHLDKPEPPKQTFATSPYVLKDSTREVQFVFFGWAHTRGDGFAWLPKERVICTGDASTNGPYNNTTDANIGNWPNVMSAALKYSPQFVLPGHGPSGGPEILTGQAAFMVELKKAVETAVASGKKLSDVVTMKGDAAAATTITLPDSVKHWVGDSLPGQVKNAWDEVTQKKPAGELPHS
jgi:glyoxylase-like metal-dependent hydrolase (beta-lactamase superfamily II)